MGRKFKRQIRYKFIEVLLREVLLNGLYVLHKNKTSYDALLNFRFFMLCILCICDTGK